LRNEDYAIGILKNRCETYHPPAVKPKVICEVI